MAESRRGYAMLLTAGDEEISSALASGMLAVRLPAASPTGHEEAGTTSADVDWDRVAHQLRVAMHREPVDYAGLIYDAEVRHGEGLYEPGSLGRLGQKLLLGYAMIVLAFERLFERVGT